MKAFLRSFGDDLGHAARKLRRSPGFTLTAIALLGAAIGASTALFSLFNALLLRPIDAVHDSKSVVRFNRLDRGQYTGGMSYPDYLDFNAKARQFSGVIAERLVPLSLNSDQPQRVNGAIVTGNFFSLLGVNAALGRTFTPDDNRTEDGHPVTVIGHHFWQRSLGADPNILGRKLVFNGHPFEVIGVAAPGFTGVEFASGTDVWLPLAMVKVAMPRNAQSQFLQQRRA
ncbi:MAG TPA: ABC transporter permease, partial [Bryobacteraceae bacterium]|nr:ABC transporter permease [Bryobacteraceae bacterium]